MGRSKESKFKNVKKFEIERRKISRRRHAYLWSVESQNAEENIDNLLHYAGVGEVRVEGAFLSEVPAIVNLPVTRVVELLDISKSTFYRAKKEENPLDMNTVDKLSSLLKVFKRGIEAFEGQEAFQDWLKSKIVNLGDQRPIDLLKTENGRFTVLDAIDRVEHGVYG